MDIEKESKDAEAPCEATLGTLIGMCVIGILFPRSRRVSLPHRMPGSSGGAAELEEFRNRMEEFLEEQAQINEVRIRALFGALEELDKDKYTFLYDMDTCIYQPSCSWES